jgi:hypothetical protein
VEADKYKERRGGSRLMSPQAVRDLMLREPSPQARYATLQRAAGPPSRRRLLARLAADRFAIDPLLFDVLDDAAQLASPPTDVLAPLCSAEFVAADLQSRPPPTEWPTAVAELRRAGMLTSTLQVRPSELAWFGATTGFVGLAQLGFGPPAGTTPAEKLLAWRRAAALYGLRASVPAQAATLEAIRATAGTATTVDDVLAVVGHAYQLPAGSATVMRLDGLVTQPTDLRDPLLLRCVDRAAQILRRVGATAEVTLSLCQAALSETQARAARGLFAGKYGPRAASDGLRAAMNTLRERQRTALVDHLIQRDGAVDAADLHARYLLDVEMGADMRTSPIKQAISSTQLFIQRWLMNLESPELPAASAELARTWEWTRSYRLWEANRKIWLFPEDWLEPSLRDDKSHLFAAFESTLLQSEVTSERAIEALRQYLDRLDEMAKITVVAMYRQSAAPRAGTVHVVGRTAHYPVQYFYRQWRTMGAAGSWDPWEPLDVVGDTDHIVVFIRNGRPHIAWLDIHDAQKSTNSSEDNDLDSPAITTGPVTSQTPNWALRLLWSRRDQNGWSAPKKSANEITYQKAINKDPAATFALRLEPGPSGSTVRCYGGSDDNNAPQPDAARWASRTVNPIPRPALVLALIELVFVQVLVKTDDTRYVAVDDAVVEIWARTESRSGIQPFDYGTAVKPLRLAKGDEPGIYPGVIVLPPPYNSDKLTINVRVTFPGSPPQTKKVQVDLDKLNDVRFGFVFNVRDTTTSSVAAKIDPTRRLRLFSIATADWGLASGLRWRPDPTWDAAVELALIDPAEHYRSGYRFPAKKPVRIFGITVGDQTAQEPVFVSATASDAPPGLGLPLYVEADSSASAGFITQGIAPGQLTFLPAAEVTHFRLQRELDAEPDTLELTTGPPDAASVASVSRLAIAAGIATPFQRENPQFSQALPYAGYDWEVFFHAPMMIAQGLATHQRYGEALRWLHTIFDPTATAGNGQRQWWRFQPFADVGQGIGIDLLLKDFSAGRLDADQQAAIQAQLDFSRKSPFRPHGIARMRIRAYQWTVVLKYLDMLIAWGDQQFRRDTIESINEATQLYLLAAELLGRHPTQLPAQPPLLGPPTFAGLAGHWDDSSNAWM